MMLSTKFCMHTCNVSFCHLVPQHDFEFVLMVVETCMPTVATFVVALCSSYYAAGKWN